MQNIWFEKINNYDNFFYIIEFKGEKIGLIDNKNTNWAGGTTDSGLFLYDKNYYETHIPVAASVILMQAGFFLLNGKDARIKILRNNKKAIDYNTHLGFEQEENQNSDSNSCNYILTKDRFLKVNKKLHEALLKLNEYDDPYYYVIIEDHDYLSGVGQQVEKVINQLDPSIVYSKIWNDEKRELKLTI
jgi:hypothetical protein